jgi:hypothetical protein
MVEILLISIIILVVLFDRLNFNNKTKNQVELIVKNVDSVTWKGFNILEIILASIFFILIISLFFNFSNLSSIISNFLANYLPFVFVYEEIAFYTLITISSIWFVIRFHFISLSPKKIMARELFNFLFIVLFVLVGYLIFHSKNLNLNNRYVTNENITPGYTFSDDLEGIEKYRTGPFELLYYDRKYYSFKGLFTSKMYPNTFKYIKEESRENGRLNYQIIDRVFYVYGEGLILNGLLVYYFIKLLLSSIIWGIKILKE